MTVNLSRRQCIAAFAAAPAAVAAAAPRIETVTPQPQYYAGWPTMARRKNGELLLVWSGGREGHVCPFGRVDLMRSHDEGKTWTWPETVMDCPIDDRDAGILETAK